jgi:hypothetical protein
MTAPLNRRGLPRFGRQPAFLRVVASNDGDTGALRPTGLSEWDRRFLRQIANWPTVLLESQRAMLRDIAERAR